VGKSSYLSRSNPQLSTMCDSSKKNATFWLDLTPDVQRRVVLRIVHRAGMGRMNLNLNLIGETMYNLARCNRHMAKLLKSDDFLAEYVATCILNVDCTTLLCNVKTMNNSTSTLSSAWFRQRQITAATALQRRIMVAQGMARRGQLEQYIMKEEGRLLEAFRGLRPKAEQEQAFLEYLVDAHTDVLARCDAAYLRCGGRAEVAAKQFVRDFVITTPTIPMMPLFHDLICNVRDGVHNAVLQAVLQDEKAREVVGAFIRDVGTSMSCRDVDTGCTRKQPTFEHFEARFTSNFVHVARYLTSTQMWLDAFQPLSPMLQDVKARILGPNAPPLNCECLPAWFGVLVTNPVETIRLLNRTDVLLVIDSTFDPDTSPRSMRIMVKRLLRKIRPSLALDWDLEDEPPEKPTCASCPDHAVDTLWELKRIVMMPPHEHESDGRLALLSELRQWENLWVQATIAADTLKKF
jgi:hypothetical protein